jgi:hypothetical protein
MVTTVRVTCFSTLRPTSLPWSRAVLKRRSYRFVGGSRLGFSRECAVIARRADSDGSAPELDGGCLRPLYKGFPLHNGRLLSVQLWRRYAAADMRIDPMPYFAIAGIGLLLLVTVLVMH